MVGAAPRSACSATSSRRLSPMPRHRLFLPLLCHGCPPRTELALGLHDLDTLARLLFQAMHQLWSYAWVSCLHHPPLLTKSRPRYRLCLKPILHKTKKRGVVKINGPKIIMRRNVTIFPMVKWITAHRNLSKHVSSLIGRHTMFDKAILQKINTNKRQSRNRWLYI